MAPANTAPPPTMTFNPASVVKSDDLVVYKYSDSPSLYQLPEIPEDSNSRPTNTLWGRVNRFAAYFFNQHIRAPSHEVWCRNPSTLLRGATRVVLFDNDGWLLTRLPSYLTTSQGYPILAATGMHKIYTEWKRWNAVLSAYCEGAAAHGKSPRRRVRLAPSVHTVSVFENKDEDLFVVMEIYGDGEIRFYRECLHCHDFTCRICTEVLEEVLAFGQRYTQVDRRVPTE